MSSSKWVLASPDLPYRPRQSDSKACVLNHYATLFILLDPLVAFVTEDSSRSLEALSIFDFHNSVLSFGFVQLLWLLFLRFSLYHPLNIPWQHFRVSLSSHSTLLCILPNFMALITTSVLKTLKSLSQTRFLS